MDAVKFGAVDTSVDYFLSVSTAPEVLGSWQKETGQNKATKQDKEQKQKQQAFTFGESNFFPVVTFAYRNDTRLTEYVGSYEPASLSAFVHRNLAPQLSDADGKATLHSAEDVRAFLARDSPVVVGCFSEAELAETHAGVAFNRSLSRSWRRASYYFARAASSEVCWNALGMPDTSGATGTSVTTKNESTRGAEPRVDGNDERDDSGNNDERGRQLLLPLEEEVGGDMRQQQRVLVRFIWKPTGQHALTAHSLMLDDGSSNPKTSASNSNSTANTAAAMATTAAGEPLQLPSSLRSRVRVLTQADFDELILEAREADGKWRSIVSGADTNSSGDGSDDAAGAVNLTQDDQAMVATGRLAFAAVGTDDGTSGSTDVTSHGTNSTAVALTARDEWFIKSSRLSEASVDHAFVQSDQHEVTLARHVLRKWVDEAPLDIIIELTPDNSFFYLARDKVRSCASFLSLIHI